MYKNVGKKIEGMAIAIFILGVLAAVAAGIVLIVKEAMVLIGVLVMVVGALVALGSSWLLYGFGQLVCKTARIEKYVEKKSSMKMIERFYAMGLLTDEEYKKEEEFIIATL